MPITSNTPTAAEQLRELVVELDLLERFDAIRRARGYDYGVGQRYSELVRRRRAIDVRAGDGPGRLGEPVQVDELRVAFDRIARPRLARLERESYRHGSRPTDRTIAAWRELARRLDVDLGGRV